MSASAHLVERHAGVVDLSVRSRPSVSAYRFGSAVSLDAAYAGTTAMFTVDKDASFRSRTLRKSGVNRVEESNRSLTRVAYDPADYASATTPGDNAMSFVRVNARAHDGTFLGEGPILVVPPPGFFGTGRRSLLLSGTAPAVVATANGTPPQTAMIIDFPKFADNVRIYNDGASSIFLAFGPGDIEIEIPPPSVGDPIYVEFVQTGVSEVYLRGDGGASAFRMIAALVQGIQA